MSVASKDTRRIGVPATFERPVSGLVPTRWSLPNRRVTFTGPGWQSNGGPARGHPSRALPFTLDLAASDPPGELRTLELVGVFALHCDQGCEPAGTVGAMVQIGLGPDPVARYELINGRHYFDALCLDPVSSFPGDGSSLETIGSVEVEGQVVRVDSLRLDVPPGSMAHSARFRDLGSAASFVIWEATFEFERPRGCPFHEGHGGVSLSEIGSIVRLGDRARFARALRQLEEGILETEDLDEARGEALTFLAVATAATLELGAPREMHRLQLHAARALEALQSREEIADTVTKFLRLATPNLYRPEGDPNGKLMERVLAHVERNFARRLSDSEVASQFGISTSYFRYLFRKATGQPFHQYLIALRLEKARQLLTESDLAVSEVAQAVGFAGLSHFSRAFAQRFSASPSQLRRSSA